MGAVAVAALTTIAGAACAQAPAAAPPAPPPVVPVVVTMVKPGLYVLSENGGNSTVRVGKDAVLLVDTKNPGEPIHAELLKAIRSITPLPVKQIIITHQHQDHLGGAAAFEAEGATVTATEALKTSVEKANAIAANKLALPTKTYSGQTAEVSINGATAKLYHFDPGHTGGDTLVYWPDLKVVSTGDEVSLPTPNIDFANGGSALGVQDSLAQLDKLDFDTLIPGHGALTLTRAQFEDYRKTWATLTERLRAAIKAGVPKDKLLASIKTDDIGWTIATLANWTAPARIDGLYAEMSK